jgi:negative regulator of flagellin synthesis FlgM
MEINGKNTLVALNPGVQRVDAGSPQPVRTRANGAEAGQSDSDRIELSVRSREIQDLDKMIRSTPDVRADRVEQIKSAVQEGTYNVKAEMIADKIIGGSIIDDIF